MSHAIEPILAELTSEQTSKLLIGSLALIIILIVLFGALMAYRRWLNTDDTNGSEGFTLSDLRRLHKAGQMTDAEYEKAKAVLIGSIKAAAEKPSAGGKEGPRTLGDDLNGDLRRK